MRLEWNRVVVIAALVAVAQTAPAEVLRRVCHGAFGDDRPTAFIVEIDLASSVITEGDFRWTATYDGATIDWNLDRRNGALRGVVLTGPDAGLSIVGECNRD